MKNKLKLFTGIFCMLVSFLLCSCGQSSAKDKDFSELTTPGSQEEAYEYRTFFLPAKDGSIQPYVGDIMPYYEDGMYYFYYLKDGGDSYHHSIYLSGLGNSLSPNFRSFFMFFFFAFLHIPENIFVKFSKKY